MTESSPGSNVSWFQEIDKARRVRMMNIIALVTLAVSVPESIITLYQYDSPRAGIIIMVGALLALAPPIGYRRGWTLQLCAWFLTASELLILALLSSQPYGTRIWSVAWASAVPLVALSIGGIRTALGICGLTLFIQWTSISAIYTTPGRSTAFGPGKYSVELMDAFLLTALVTAIGVALEHSKSRAIHQIENSHRALHAEADDHRKTHRELKRTHRELIKSARVAGMAEVASGVLHNVGNALTSVKTSTSVVMRTIEDLAQVGPLNRASGLIARDPGVRVPCYQVRQQWRG